MDRTLAFRRTLLARLLAASALALPLAAAAGAGCSGTVGGTGGNGGNSGNPMKQCFAWPEGDAGTACPEGQQALTMLNANSCGNTIMGVGTYESGQCCYEVNQMSCVLTGRPYVEDSRPLAAAERRDAQAKAWSGDTALRPHVGALSADQRARLAAAWASDGLLEHASVAAFGRVALELMAAGAPAELLAETHRAALDEIEHARLSLGLAGAYAGEPVAPGPFPFEGRVEVSADLASIAARAVREGCIGETLGAVQAAEQLAAAEDPAVRAALAAIAEDEARHAALAWRTVAWALAQGGGPVRAAVTAAFAEPVVLPEAAASGVSEGAPDPALAAHGRPGARALRAALVRALDEVVRPCAESLLGAC